MSLRNCPLFFVMDTGFRIHLDGDFGEAQGFALREVMAYAIVKHRAHARREVKCATHARRHFTCRRHTSRTEGVLIVPLGTLSCKKSLVFRQGSFYWWGKMGTLKPKIAPKLVSSPIAGRTGYLNCMRVQHHALKICHRHIFVPLRDGHRLSNPSSFPPDKIKTTSFRMSFLVGEDGFEPSKSLTTDLQSAPFGRSGIPPY